MAKAKDKDRRIQSGEFNRAGCQEGSVVVSKTTRNANSANTVPINRRINIPYANDPIVG